VRTKSGKIREVLWQLAVSPSEVEDAVVLFAVGQDTTDKNLLAHRVRQTEKLAAVVTLAAGLAHEIRNPLNGAALHVTFLERGLKRSGRAGGEAMEAVKVVGDEIKRLSALVSEFLDFARPQPLVKRRSSIRTLCERSVQMAAPDAAAASIQVKTDLPVADLELDLDAAKMEQVLLNLLKNAIEAQAPEGRGSVTLRVRRQPRQEIIEVEDEGPGLSDVNAPIFDPFFSTKPQGIGLGLAIAHRIVTDHEGAIDVHSRPGKTVFRITLPILLTG
jgi:signal transduction histidine kinase